VAAVDYEAEYNNRARVPEHPQIFARWAGDSEFFRADMLKSGRAELGLSFGDTPKQYIDLFMPEMSGNVPLALFIHGGWWRSLDPSYYSQVARGPVAHGVQVALAGYDLCPTVTLAEIVEQMRQACLFLWLRYSRRIMVYGHSAGGHLAGVLVATDWAALYPKAPGDLVTVGYSVSGVFDLAPLVGISVNQDLKLTPTSARELSPALWPLKLGRSFDAVVGGLESSEFKRQSHLIADTWQKTGKTRYEEVAGTNHFTVVDPLADPESAMTARVVELARSVAS